MPVKSTVNSGLFSAYSLLQLIIMNPYKQPGVPKALTDLGPKTQQLKKKVYIAGAGPTNCE